MPEVAVHEDSHFGISEDKIRATGKGSVMSFEGESRGSQQGGDVSFGCRVAAFDPRHHATSLFR